MLPKDNDSKTNFKHALLNRYDVTGIIGHQHKAARKQILVQLRITVVPALCIDAKRQRMDTK